MRRIKVDTFEECDIKDSNVELIGTEIDSKVKYNSAATELACMIISYSFVVVFNGAQPAAVRAPEYIFHIAHLTSKLGSSAPQLLN
jgi:hypothetical protein